MTTAGQLVVLKIAGIDVDPIGDFTLREKRIKREVTETTRKNTYLSEVAQSGMINGQIANDPNLDRKTISESKDVSVLAEEPNGRLWEGTMTYTADAETAVNDGTFQIEMKGDLRVLPA